MSETHAPTDVPSQFQLVDPGVAKNPGTFFEGLRSGCPAARFEEFGGFWALSRYRDVYDAALDTETFSSTSGITIPDIPHEPVPCLEMDEPDHRKYRRPMQGWFSVKRISAWEDKVRAIVNQCLDEMIEERRGDLAKGLASPVPPMVIALILGLPEENWAWFRERQNTLLRYSQAGDMENGYPVYLDIANCLSDTIEERRRAPQDDMLSDIAALTIDGERISHEVAVSLAYLILGAGHETTVSGIGGLLYRVAGDSDLRDRLKADPSLIGAAIEESLRLETPMPGLARTVLGHTSVEGVTMSAGDRVMLLWGAANRDPDVFEAAEHFRLDRGTNKHIAFGAGVHRCVGAPLARLEMRVALEEVLRRMPGVHLTDAAAVGVRWTVGREFSHLDVTW